mgnify:CR=1 FL=1
MRYVARIVFASIILLACNGEIALSTHNSCLVHPQLLVIPGAMPVFTYPPECGLSSLHVVMVTPSTTSTQVVWSFTVSGQTMVASSIRYGSAPVCHAHYTLRSTMTMGARRWPWPARTFA